jgi:hypothetical protein
MSKWQNIISAPKDGTPIWIGSSWRDTAGYSGASVLAAYWNEKYGAWGLVSNPDMGMPGMHYPGVWQPWSPVRPDPPEIPRLTKEFVESAKSMGIVVNPDVEREAVGAEPSE